MGKEVCSMQNYHYYTCFVCRPKSSIELSYVCTECIYFYIPCLFCLFVYYSPTVTTDGPQTARLSIRRTTSYTVINVAILLVHTCGTSFYRAAS